MTRAAGERFRLKTPPVICVTTTTLEPEEAERFADALADVQNPEARTVART